MRAGNRGHHRRITHSVWCTAKKLITKRQGSDLNTHAFLYLEVEVVVLVQVVAKDSDEKFVEEPTAYVISALCNTLFTNHDRELCAYSSIISHIRRVHNVGDTRKVVPVAM
jgi:hypothetical protein